jgi:uncharacterized repeat protein (TIGR01451 family)
MAAKLKLSHLMGMRKIIRRQGLLLAQALIILSFLIAPLGVNAAPLENKPATEPLPAGSQTPSWFNSAWTYRLPVTISNAGTALTDYQVLVTLNGGNFNFSHARIDGADLRVANTADAALPFWIESWDSGAQSARIWVRVDTIPATGTTIYLYFGNLAAVAASNGAATFDLFDDDWTGLGDRWTTLGTNPSVSGGIAQFGSGSRLQSTVPFATGHAIGYRGWFTTSTGLYKWGGFLLGNNAPFAYIGTYDLNAGQVSLTNYGSARVADALGALTDGYHIYELTWTSLATQAYVDYAASPAGTLTTEIPQTALPVQLGNYDDGGGTFDVDWVYLRNYRSPEPAGSIGTEENRLLSADLALTVTDTPDPVAINTELSYQITITNQGPLDAVNLVLTDLLPAGITLVSATPSDGGTCSGTTTIQCNFAALANSSTASVTLVVTPTVAGTVVNAPSVTSDTPDYTPANNSASASTIVTNPSAADLEITKSDSPDPVQVGSSLTYTLTVVNHGPADATGVTLVDTLPTTVAYVSATPNQGSCSHAGTVTCEIGALANGSNAVVTIVVTPGSAGTITNQASVSGGQSDPNSTNDSSTTTTQVIAPSLGALVLVNSTSAAYTDFQHLIQPYLDHFGVPYDVLDIATTPVTAAVQNYALIITGHRQIDTSGTYLDSTEQGYLSAAVTVGGSGLINFDNDLTADGLTARYAFIQAIFNYTYSTASTGTSIVFTPNAHYITARHAANETIATNNGAPLGLAGIVLPGDATALATSNSVPFLAVRTSGAGHAVQWGSYDWMPASIRGPVYGLDDLIWRSMAWAARKPFVFQGMPPFVTMRVDDVSGPFDWIHIANEVGIKPWASLFLENIDDTEAADLSGLVQSGNATTSIHSFDGTRFYWGQTDAQMATNYAFGTAWHANHNIPISKYVLPHYYEIGTNAFAGLAQWGVECVGTQMTPGTTYGSLWVTDGPFRLYDTGSSSSTQPLYYADYLTIPGHPEFNNRFFNLVTEIRDDLTYEWYPDNNIAYSIAHGTLQTKRALDGMELATLFTHDQYVSQISAGNWLSILQGITTNLASYNPIYVTMDDACQYAISKHNSRIASTSFDATNRVVTVNFSGTTEVPTKFYLFTEEAGSVREILVDVPQFSGSAQVLFTLPGPLHHVVVTPSNATVIAGATRQFTAMGYDANNNPIPNLPVTWTVASGGGTITSSGLFTAGSTPGTYNNTVTATIGAFSGTASVTVEAATLHHFAFQTIASPHYVNVPFQVTITARDAAGNLFTGFAGSVALSASAGAITPATTGNFTAGTWSGSITLDTVAPAVAITASANSVNGTSNSFAVLAVPPLHHFAIHAIGSPQIRNVPFGITITAYDSANNPLPVYNGTPALSASLGTISPTVTSAFSGATWVGNVTLDAVGTGITIMVSDGTIATTSNAFDVQLPPPYYQVTSTQYNQAINTSFNVTVTGYQTTLDCSNDSHQDPVLATTTDVNTLNYNLAAGQWTEFLYTLSRPYPSVMAAASYVGTLPTMHFYANGIPNGRFRVIANLYDNAPMRYYFGFTSAEPRASYIETAGGLTTGTQHREYDLGTVDIASNTFDLYVNDAVRLGGTYDAFGWAWVRLVPVEPPGPSEISFYLYDDNYQDPDLGTTSSVDVLLANSRAIPPVWTEFLYDSRPFPSIMASALHTTGLPTMHFSHSSIANGDYEVFALLYNTNPMRYYYGFTSDNPQAAHVDTSGSSQAGDQHLEYSLGTITITNGEFNLYVNRADELTGAIYDIFGWARIRLVPLFSVPDNMTITSSSATMVFDGDGDGTFGEPGDNIKALVNGILTIPTRDSATGTPTITATDFLGQIGAHEYILFDPTGVDLNYFRAYRAAGGVQLAWETVNEATLAGFNLYRREPGGKFEQVNVELIPPARGGQPEGFAYAYLDEGAQPGLRYEYRLESVETDLQSGTVMLADYYPYSLLLPLIRR